jgi:hypothetical protein
LYIHNGDGPTFAAAVHPLNWPVDNREIVAFPNPNYQNGKKENAKNADKFGPAKSAN